MRFVAFFACAFLAVAACADDGDGDGNASEAAHETVRAVRQAIVNGAVSDPSQDAVVLISEARGDRCTGTLIAPNLVLTARHCVAVFNDYDECGLPIGFDLDAVLFTVSAGPYAKPQQPVARGSRLYTTNTRDGLCGGDIALLLLDKDVPNAKVARVRFAPPAVDELTAAVGYGDDRTERTQRKDVQVLSVGPVASSYTTLYGRKFQMDVRANELATSESTCYGDSGGPLLDSIGQIMGVASRGLPHDDACQDRPTLWTSLAAHQQLIETAAIAAGHPLVPALPAPPAKFGPTATEERPGKAPRKLSSGGEAQAEAAPDGADPQSKSGSVGCTAQATSPHDATGLLACSLLVNVLVLARARRRGAAAVVNPTRRPPLPPRPRR